MTQLWRILGELADRLETAASLLVVADYDGTLVRPATDPAAARLSPGVRQDLHTLAYSQHARVGVISARSLGDLRARVGLRGLIYAGCHGLEVEEHGFVFRHPDAQAQRPTLQALARTLTRRLAFVQDVRVEAKGLAVAVHYCGAAREVIGRVYGELERAIREHPGTFKILRGNNAVEILPDVQWNNGECALWIRDRVSMTLPSPVLMLYIGDEGTDEIAFSALSGKALTVRVGSECVRTNAAYRLGSVREVHQLLLALSVEVGRGGYPFWSSCAD